MGRGANMLDSYYNVGADQSVSAQFPVVHNYLV